MFLLLKKYPVKWIVCLGKLEFFKPYTWIYDTDRSIKQNSELWITYINNKNPFAMLLTSV